MKVNGKDFKFKEGITVDNLLSELNFNKDRVVVEIDKQIIPKDKYYKTNLKESNIVEVINFVGGGWYGD